MTEELICDNLIKISYRLRSELWMKYVKIYNNYETKKDSNAYDRLINNLKEELSQLQDYTTSQLYETKDADFRNGILDLTKCFLKLFRL